jgi:hypothetical protein
MKLQTAMLARYAEVEPQGGLLNVTGGGVDVFGIPNVPADFPMAFVLQLTFDQTEADIEHRLGVTVLGPELQPVGEHIDLPFTPRFGEYRPEGWRGIFAVTGAIDLRVEAYGAHSIQIRFDGELAGDIPFLAVKP